jgi:hypothetical protein
MRVIRFLGLVAVAGTVGVGAVACVSTVSGQATLAADATGPTATSTDTPTVSPSPSDDPTPSDTPTPTVDPIKTKEQVTCVLLQATVKTTNDKFNSAKTRDAQITVLRGGASGLRAGLRASGLPHNDRIFVLGNAIFNELSKVVAGADRGASPSTAPYNNATNKFRTACLSL